MRALAVTERHARAFIHADVRSQNESRAGTTTKESDRFLEEGIAYVLQGYVYHPNLLSWNAQFRLGLSQQRITVDSNQDNTNGNLLGYDINALLLQQKPVSVQLSSSNNDEFLQRSFARTNEYKTQRQAVEIISHYLVNSSLLYEDLNTDEISDIRETKTHTRQLRFSALSSSNPDKYTSLVYEHEDTAQTDSFSPPGEAPTIVDEPTKRDEATFTNMWRFGSKVLPDTLSGRARYLNRKGFFPDQVITLEQRLDLAHTSTFSTYYHGIYDSEKTDANLDRLLMGEAGFLKKFYGSLDLGGRVSLSTRNFGTGTEDITGLYMTADYRKHTSLGLFQSYLDLGREREKQTSRSGIKPILDEAVTLSGITFVPLSQPNVLPGTIVVKSADHTFTYREGIDYQVQTIGAVTQIARLGGGLIGDPESVLVSYSVTAALADTFNRTLIAWTNRLGLKWLPLWLYYDYHLRDEELVSGDNPGNLDRTSSKLVGIEYRSGSLDAAAEHEIRGERLSPPSVADRLRIQYHRRLSDRLDLTLGGNTERVRYSEGARFGLERGRDRLNVTDAFVRLTTRLRRNVLLLLNAEYYDSTGQTNSKLTRLGVSLQGSLRSLDFSIRARHSIFTQEQTNGARDTLTFNVSRRF